MSHQPIASLSKTSGLSSTPAQVFRRLPAVGAALCAMVGITALVGWQWDLIELRSILPGRVSMNPLTAMAFVLACLALVTLRYGGKHAAAPITGRLLGAVVAAIGLLKVSDIWGGTSFHIDQVLYHGKLLAVGTTTANQMAPNTAFAFVITGVALLAFHTKAPHGVPLAQLLALPGLGVSLLAMLGYALDVHQLYNVPSFIPMALNTAVGFCALSLGILFSVPERGITAVFVTADAGGAMARRLIPLALLVPPLLALLRMHAQRAGVFEVESGVSMMVFTSSVLLTTILWLNAARLSRSEADRLAALRDLEQAHEGLEARVAERTAELEASNERLAAEAEERLRATAALKDSEERYRLLFEDNPHPMWVYDRDTLRFLAVNETAVRLYGYSREEFLEMTIKDIRPAEDVARLLENVAQARPDLTIAREWRHRRKDGTVMAVEITSHTLAFAGRDAVLTLAHDVTTQRQLEDQLRQAQKMEAVGQLAGGVAHDFNNLLTAILGHCQLMQLEPNLAPAMVEDLDEIEKASNRAADLTRQLLAFSRRQMLQPKVLDLNSVIAGMDKMLRRLIREDIDLRSFPAADLGHVQADPGQIEQVLMNLVVNARDAMPEGGCITIETSNVTFDEANVFGREGLLAGRYVMLAVSDDGSGMDAQTRSRIFEPFFTTKDIGRGTGLGLSTVHGIIKQSGGHIEVYSEVGSGSTFKIYLPLVEGAIEALHQDRPQVAQLSGAETILVIEDDDQVRNIVTKALRLNGYSIIEATDRSTALATAEDCRRANIALDLVLSDLIMPGPMSAPELEWRLKDLYPDVPILYMSGYTDRAMEHHGVLSGNAAYLQKPFTGQALLLKVREQFGTGRAQAA